VFRRISSYLCRLCYIAWGCPFAPPADVSVASLNNTTARPKHIFRPHWVASPVSCVSGQSLRLCYNSPPDCWKIHLPNALKYAFSAIQQFAYFSWRIQGSPHIIVPTRTPALINGFTGLQSGHSLAVFGTASTVSAVWPRLGMSWCTSCLVVLNECGSRTSKWIGISCDGVQSGRY
jgi:hypothetical protein